MRTGIFIDIDGTLTDDNKKISEVNKLIIRDISRLKSFEIYLITGKSLHNAISFYEQLNLNTELITSAGQIITNPKLNKIERQIFTNEKDVLHLIKKLKAKDIFSNFLFETSDHKYYMQKLEKSNMAHIVAGEQELSQIKDETLNNIVGAYIELKNIEENKLSELMNELNDSFKDLSVTYWMTEGNPHVLQIKPRSSGKLNAVKFIKDKNHLEKTICIGNGLIDVDMIKWCDLGIAMKNSARKIKKVANMVTEHDNNNSGVGRELLRLFGNKLG